MLFGTLSTKTAFVLTDGAARAGLNDSQWFAFADINPLDQITGPINLTLANNCSTQLGTNGTFALTVDDGSRDPFCNRSSNPSMFRGLDVSAYDSNTCSLSFSNAAVAPYISYEQARSWLLCLLVVIHDGPYTDRQTITIPAVYTQNCTNTTNGTVVTTNCTSVKTVAASSSTRDVSVVKPYIFTQDRDFNLTVSLKDALSSRRRNGPLTVTLPLGSPTFTYRVSPPAGKAANFSWYTRQSSWPNKNPSATYIEGDVPKQVFPWLAVWFDTAFAWQVSNAQQARITLGGYCNSADTIYIPLQNISYFQSVQPLATVSAGNATGCYSQLTVAGLASADEYSRLLSSLRFYTDSRNNLQGLAYRNITFEISAQTGPTYETSLFATVAVLPVNDAIRWPTEAGPSSLPAPGVPAGSAVITQAGPTLFLDEGSQPLVQVTVAVNCSDPQLAATAAASSIRPSICLEDPDPAAAPGIIRQGAGSSGLPLAVIQTSRYAFSIIPAQSSVWPSSAATATTLASIAMLPVGATVWDCADYSTQDSASRALIVAVNASATGTSARFSGSIDAQSDWAPLPCWRQSFRIWNQPFDYENATHPRSITLALDVTDIYDEDYRLQSDASASQSISITVNGAPVAAPGAVSASGGASCTSMSIRTGDAGVDEAAALGPIDASDIASCPGVNVLQGVKLTINITDIDDQPIISFANATQGPDLMMDEAEQYNGYNGTGGAEASKYWRFLTILDQDLVDANNHTLVITSVPFASISYSSLSASWNSSAQQPRVGPSDGTRLVNGNDVASLFTGLRTGAAASDGNGGWVEQWTVVPKPGVVLSQAGIKSDTLLLNVAVATAGRAGSASTYPSVNVRVVITRSNAPVAFTSPSITASLSENSPIGTVVTRIAAFDADVSQNLTYSIISCNSSLPSAAVPASGLLDALFTLQPVVTLLTYTDSSTGRVLTAPITRSVDVVVSRDAIDYDAGDRVISLQMLVSDNGVFNNSALQWPASAITTSTAPITSALLNVTVVVTRDGSDPTNDVPTIVSIASGVPASGLSVYGGDVIEITGTGLGLPDGPAAQLTGWLISGNVTSIASMLSIESKLAATTFASPISAVLANSTGLVWQLQNCVVVTRLTRVQCTSPAGYGQNMFVMLRVSGNYYSRFPGLALSPVPQVSYQLPLVTSITRLDTANPDLRLLPPAGTLDDAAVGAGTIDTTGIEIRGSGFPPMLDLPSFNISMVAGPRILYLSACNRPDVSVFHCAVPTAVSTGYEVSVSVAGVSSRPPIVSYAPPIITKAYIDQYNPYTLIIEGVDLGTDQLFGIGGGIGPNGALGAGARITSDTSSASIASLFGSASTSGAVTSTSAIAMSGVSNSGGAGGTGGWVGFDRIEYAADPLNASPSRCAAVAPYATCGTLVAKACMYTVQQSSIKCTLDVDGYGVGFRARAIVGGQASPWSSSTFDYPAPVLRSLAPVPTTGLAVGKSNQLEISVEGGTLIRIVGTGIVAGDCTTLSIGGVEVPLRFVYVNPDSRGVNVGAGEATGPHGTLYAPGAYHPDYVFINVTGSLVHSVEAYAPPGFGNVTVRLSVGNRSVAISAAYEGLYYTKQTWGSGNLQSLVKSVNLMGSGMARCVFCYAWESSGNLKEACANISTATCALPDSMRTGMEAGTYPKPGSVPGGQFGFCITDSVVDICIGAYSVGPRDMMVNGTQFQFETDVTTSSKEVYPLTIYQAGSDPLTTTFDFNFLLAKPTLQSVFPNTWTADGGSTATLTVTNGGPDPGLVWVDLWGSTYRLTCPYVMTTDVGAPSVKAEERFRATGKYTSAQPKGCNSPACVVASEMINETDRGNMVVDSTAGMWVYKEYIPCHVTRWQDGSVDLITPSWQGYRGVIRVVAGSVPTNESLDITFANPVISSVDGDRSTRGGLVTISGSGFGRYQSVGANINALIASGFLTNITSTDISDQLRLDFQPHVIRFSYSGAAEDQSRYCTVFSWNTRAIVCKAPHGISGSFSTVAISISDNAAGLDNLVTTSSATFHYNLPYLYFLETIGGVEAGTDGGYEVVLHGRDFSFVRPSATSVLAKTPAATPTPDSTSNLNGTNAALADSNTSSANATDDSTNTSSLPSPSQAARLLRETGSPVPSAATAAVVSDAVGGAPTTSGVLRLLEWITGSPRRLQGSANGTDDANVTSTPAASSSSSSPSMSTAPGSTASSSPSFSAIPSPVPSAAANAVNEPLCAGGSSGVRIIGRCGTEFPSSSCCASDLCDLNNGMVWLTNSSSKGTSGGGDNSSSITSPSIAPGNCSKGESCTLLYGYNRLGGTINVTCASSPGECGDICDQLPACAAFTHNNVTKACYLKNNTYGAPTTASSSLTSGWKMPAVDASGNGFWAPKVVVRAAKGTNSETIGLVFGSPADYYPAITVHDHDQVRFVMPRFEGKVEISLQFESTSKQTYYSDPLAPYAAFIAAPPVITRVYADGWGSSDVLANNSSPGSEDPCSALHYRNISDSCIADARSIYDWGSLPIDTRRPCFRAPNGSAVLTTIVIEGRNFGDGTSSNAASVKLVQGLKTLGNSDGSASAAEWGAVSITGCSAPPGSATVYNTSSQLRCQVASLLPRGPVDLSITVAYNSIRSSQFSIIPRAVCACGFYSASDGSTCSPCPNGAKCAGALEQPRAVADYWRTEEKQWSDRYINVTTEQIPSFVQCPVQGLCAPNQVCATGSDNTSWMCVKCAEGYSKALTGTCDYCGGEGFSGAETQKTLGGLGAAIALVTGLAFWLRSRTRKREQAEATAGGGKKKDDPSVPSFVTLFKIGTTYAQTLGALSSYAEPSKLKAQPQFGDPNLIPSVLRNVKVFQDFGMSLHSMQCTLAAMSGSSSSEVIYYWKLYAYMVAPIIAVIGVPMLFGIYTGLTQLSCWPGQKQKVSDLIKTASFYTSLAVFAALPPSISQLARAQNCADIKDGMYLVDDPEISCADPKFIAVKQLALVIGYAYILVPVLIASLLYPVTSIWCCFKNHDRRKAKKEYNAIAHKRLKWTRERFRFLWDGYLEHSGGVPYMWECLVLLRKALFMGLSTGFLFLTDSRTQIMMTIILLCLSFAMHMAAFPYKADAINALELWALGGELMFGFAILVRMAVSAAVVYAKEVQDVNGAKHPVGEVLSDGSFMVKNVKWQEQLMFDIVALVPGMVFVILWVGSMLDWMFFKGQYAKKGAKWAGFTSDDSAAAAAGLPDGHDGQDQHHHPQRRGKSTRNLISHGGAAAGAARPMHSGMRMDSGTFSSDRHLGHAAADEDPHFNPADGSIYHLRGLGGRKVQLPRLLGRSSTLRAVDAAGSADSPTSRNGSDPAPQAAGGTGVTTSTIIGRGGRGSSSSRSSHGIRGLVTSVLTAQHKQKLTKDNAGFTDIHGTANDNATTEFLNPMLALASMPAQATELSASAMGRQRALMRVLAPTARVPVTRVSHDPVSLTIFHPSGAPQTTASGANNDGEEEEGEYVDESDDETGDPVRNYGRGMVGGLFRTKAGEHDIEDYEDESDDGADNLEDESDDEDDEGGRGGAGVGGGSFSVTNPYAGQARTFGARTFTLGNLNQASVRFPGQGLGGTSTAGGGSGGANGPRVFSFAPMTAAAVSSPARPSASNSGSATSGTTMANPARGSQQADTSS